MRTKEVERWDKMLNHLKVGVSVSDTLSAIRADIDISEAEASTIEKMVNEINKPVQEAPEADGETAEKSDRIQPQEAEDPNLYKSVSYEIRNGRPVTPERIAKEKIEHDREELVRLRENNFQELEHIACMAYPALKLLADHLWLYTNGDDPADARCGIAWLLELVGEKLEDAHKNPHR